MKKTIIALSLILSACASEHKLSTLDLRLEEKGRLSRDTSIGVNSSGEAVVRESQEVSQKLKGEIWWNNSLEQELASLQAETKRCRVELADPRLGGSGEVVEIPEIDSAKPTIKVKEELGLDGDRIVSVREEFLKDKLSQERKYREELEKTIELVKKHKAKCETYLSMARVKNGLPAERTQGKFVISEEGKLLKVESPHERNLDDAFEIKRNPVSVPSKKEVELQDLRKNDLNDE